jgi:hypothetical protein
MQSFPAQKNIIIGFSRPKKSNILSNLIMKVIGSSFSHTYLSFRSESLNRNLIYQGNKKGLHFLNKDKFTKENQIVAFFSINLPKEKYIKALQSCVDHAGDQYGFLQLIGIGLSLLLSKVGIKWKNKYYRGFICSEIVAQVLIDSGLFDISDFGKNINDITPKDIYIIMQTK